MTMFPRLVPAVLLFGLAGCQLPLAFQDPATARDVPAWQTQGRFPGQAPATNPTAANPNVVQAYPQGYAPGAVTAPQQVPGGAYGQPVPQQYPQAVQLPAGQGQPYPYGRPAASQSGAPLLGWDGSVTQPPQGGEIRAVADVGTHGLQESVEGRMHIIELYQSVLDERDQLLDEVETLKVALERGQRELETERASSTGLGVRVTELEAELTRLAQENRDIATRLTQAQVRRLEAEKLLLETQIAWHQERGASAPSTAQQTGMERP